VSSGKVPKLVKLTKNKIRVGKALMRDEIYSDEDETKMIENSVQ
jgi:hypothetical protein